MKYKYESSRTDAEILELLISCASTGWQAVARVVGNGMLAHQQKYGGEIIGDLILEERLRHFAENGHFEIDDASLPYGKYRVRIATTEVSVAKPD